MSIQMTGIEHSRAGVEIRELFTFTKKRSAQAMQWFIGQEDITGCVILSTCNRTEIWISSDQEETIPVYERLCLWKNLEQAAYKEYFISRKGPEAVDHLFRLGCGLQSQILGEDQILTQVKEALAWSREQYCTDRVLETLFRMAVTAAKKVKTDIRLTTEDRSAIHAAIHMLRQEDIDIRGKKCMVIGNGEMGRLSAAALQEQGADVTVTVRQYRSGVVSIPLGCKMIPYKERMDYFGQCEIVISATASPNYTIKEQDIQQADIVRPIYLFDLAVPRDVEDSARNHPLLRLWNMDDLHQSEESDSKLEEELKAVSEILNEQIYEFWDWYNCKDIYPRVKEVTKQVVKDLELRIDKTLHSLVLDQDESERLENQIRESAGKVMNKMIYGMRKYLPDDEFRVCVDSLEKVFPPVGEMPSEELNKRGSDCR